MSGRGLHRVLASVCVVLAAALVAVSIYAIRDGRRADAARRDADDARALAAASLAEVDRTPELALLLALGACRRACDSPPEENYETRHSLVTALQRSARLQKVLHDAGQRTEALAFSPNGRWLAARSTDRISIWDLTRGVKHGQPLRVGGSGEMLFTSDGRLSFVDDGVRTLDVERMREVGRPLRVRVIDDDYVRLIDLSPDGKLVGVTGEQGAFNLWDVSTRARVEGFLQSRFSGGVFSPDSRSLIAYSGSYAGRDPFVSPRTATVWDLERGVEISRLPFRLPFRLAPFAFSADGRTLAFATAGAVRLWDVARNAPSRVPLRVRGDIVGLAFNPVGDRLAAVTHGGTVSIWDPRPGRSRAYATAGGVPSFSIDAVSPVSPTSFSPDGRTLAVATETGIALFNPARLSALAAPIRAPAAITAFTPDGRGLAASTGDGTIRIWNVTAGHPLVRKRVLYGTGPFLLGVSTLAFSPDAEMIAAGGSDGSVRRGGVDSGTLDEEVIEARGGYLEVGSLLFSPDGTMLVIDGQLWKRGAGMQARRLPRDGVPVGFRSDGTIAFAPSDGGRLRFWSLDTGQPHDDDYRVPGYPIGISSDGLRVATDDTAGTRLWTLSGGRAGEYARLPPSDFESASLSRDGSTLALAGNDALTLWDADHAAPLGDPVSGDYRAVAISPRGQLATSGRGKYISLWDDVLLSTDVGAWRKRLCPLIGRILSEPAWRGITPAVNYRETCG